MENMETLTDEEFEKKMNEVILENDSEPADEAIDDENDNNESDENTEDESELDDDTAGSEDDEDIDNENEDNEDELEQSEDDDIDTDSNESTEDEAEDEEESEESDESSTDLDEEPKDEEESTDDTEEKVQEKLWKVKADGIEYEFTAEELAALAPKALNYTPKMQEIAPWRKTISAMKEENISPEDIYTMIDVLKGDKGALNNILKRTGIDALELGDEDGDSYVPNSYGKSNEQLNIEDVISPIVDEPEYAITQKIISKQWDEDSKEKFINRPELISKLHDDVKNGVYEKVAPIAAKMKLFSNDSKKSDIDYYVEAGQVYYNGLEQERLRNAEIEQAKKAEKVKIAKAKQNSIKRSKTKRDAEKRKSARITKNRSSTKDVIDYLDADAMTDEEFSAFMDKEIKRK